MNYLRPFKTILFFAFCLLPATALYGESYVDKGKAAADKLGWKLAVHSYTFRKFSILEAIDKTAEAGIGYMSISGSVNVPKEDGGFETRRTASLTADEFAQIQERMKARGISPKFLNMGVVKPSKNEKEARKLFEAAKKLGIDMLVTEPETHGKMEELPKVMDVVEKLAEEYQIKVAIHNHPGPQNFYWHPDTVAKAIEGRSKLLGACADVGHWVRSGLDPIECLQKLEGRVMALHFKDLNEKGKRNAHDMPWGTGISNVRGMMEELKRQKFEGAFCVEYEHNWDNSLPEITQSAKYFYQVCEELAKDL